MAKMICRNLFPCVLAIACAVFLMAPVRTQSISYGTGCGSPNLTLSASSPRLGSLLTFTTRNVPSASVISVNLLTFGQVSPGIDLGSLGAPGCFQLVSSAGAYTTFLLGNPTDTNSLLIPPYPSYLGKTFYSQSVSLVPFYNALEAITSNGVASTIYNSAAVPLMVQIPSGSFMMGSANSTALPNEAPVHQVAITQNFWIGKYEVTQAEYQAVTGVNPSGFLGANRPVEQVSWTQAMSYCADLTTSERSVGLVPAGYRYRLPTEAEWEYCCRAGTTTEWSAGTNLTNSQANINNLFGQTRVVGSYAPNAFGLCDMHGNVWELCLDWYNRTNNYPSAPVSDPYVTNGLERISRGGSYQYAANNCRSATRGYTSPSNALNYVGFRIVLAPELTRPVANMVPIPAGSFAMGSDLGSANEQPVHQVTITQPFWAAKYEVTQAEYVAVMGGNPSHFQSAGSASRPVEQVTWTNAMTYCAALTTAERTALRVPSGYQYRLATEAEWEYCCRAGTTTEYNTGTSISALVANISNPSGQTTAVGSYAANSFGLYDTHGNVLEWCLDWFDLTNNYQGFAVSDPYVSNGPYRVYRGGSWNSIASVCRSATRNGTSPGSASDSIGFRIVLAPIIIP
ncbi:MAG: hypothetical protein EXS02_00660 [Planctomycetes bacterium]|nr:hypothetical protein [Planctomycetota bacterium]